MRFSILALLFTSVFMWTSSFGQNESEQVYVSHTSYDNDPKPLLSYLFQKYGIEETELIILRIQEYETVNNIQVLEDSAYQREIEKINLLISNAQDSQEIITLNNLKNRISSILSIEPILTAQ